MSRIGIFDSGFGGLTVLKEVTALLPQYDYLYFGDSARAPYGSKSREEIYQYTKEAVDYLFRRDCSLVILACNTASAEALRRIQQEYLTDNFPEKRVLGVIIPTVEVVAGDSKVKKVGIVATTSTVESETYIKEFKKIAPNLEVFQSAAPELVPMIESGTVSGERVRQLLEHYIEPLVTRGMDSLILGCTHYAIIESEFRKVLSPAIKIFNQSTVVAEKLGDYLNRHPEIESELSRGGGVEYLCTGSCRIFDKLAKHLLGLRIKAEQVQIGGTK